VDRGDGSTFNIAVNSAATAPTPSGDNRVYSYIDPHFVDPICDKLTALQPGLYISGFPKLDYWQDRSLLDIRRMRPVPYKDPAGARFDINDQIDGLLTIDESTPCEQRPYNNGRETQDRTFWRPSGPGVGFLFPAQDGLHETDMNQGNPAGGGHERENGVFQNGAMIVQKADGFAAIFTAFQTQWLPTDVRGLPVANAKPLPEFIGLS
jgi:uncharacterized protein YukJ